MGYNVSCWNFLSQLKGKYKLLYETAPIAEHETTEESPGSVPEGGQRWQLWGKWQLWSRRSCKFCKSAIEIGDQIVHILEPDVKPDRRSARRPGGGGADLAAVERDGEALKAAPGCPHAEQGEGVEERQHGRLRHRLEHHREQSAGAGEVAPEDRVAGILGQPRMQHAQHL